MALKLRVDKKRNLQKLVRRAAAKRLDKALRILHGRQRDPRLQDKAVHESRKRLKEVRALVRLVRSGLGEKTYRRTNWALRDAGRPLSAVRDATAVIEALEKLKRTGLAAVHAELVKRRTAVRHAVIDQDRALQRAERAVRKVRRESDRWSIAGRWKTVAAGIETTYRKGRRAMKKCFESADDDQWHQWRKRVKDLRYQLEMLAPLWPQVLEDAAEEAKSLTDLLGDDHDLAVLASLADVPALAGAIEQRREELRKQAAVLGEKVFAEKPAAFVKRLHTYWRTPQR